MAVNQSLLPLVLTYVGRVEELQAVSLHQGLCRFLPKCAGWSCDSIQHFLPNVLPDFHLDQVTELCCRQSPQSIDEEMMSGPGSDTIKNRLSYSIVDVTVCLNLFCLDIMPQCDLSQVLQSLYTRNTELDWERVSHSENLDWCVTSCYMDINAIILVQHYPSCVETEHLSDVDSFVGFLRATSKLGKLTLQDV